MAKTWQEHNEAFAAGGRRAIAELQAEHDALAGPTILDMRKHGEPWNAIAGYLDLSGVSSPSQHRNLPDASNWTGRAVKRIHERLAPDPRQRELFPAQAEAPKPQNLGDLARDLMVALEDAGAEDLARTLEHVAGEIEYREIAA